MSAICVVLYLAQCKRPDIVFSSNLLARYNFTPISWHKNENKHILKYLRETIDLKLFYSNSNNSFGLIGNADVEYLLDPYMVRS